MVVVVVSAGVVVTVVSGVVSGDVSHSGVVVVLMGVVVIIVVVVERPINAQVHYHVRLIFENGLEIFTWNWPISTINILLIITNKKFGAEKFSFDALEPGEGIKVTEVKGPTILWIWQYSNLTITVKG